MKKILLGVATLAATNAWYVLSYQGAPDGRTAPILAITSFFIIGYALLLSRVARRTFANRTNSTFAVFLAIQSLLIVLFSQSFYRLLTDSDSLVNLILDVFKPWPNLSLSVPILLAYLVIFGLSTALLPALSRRMNVGGGAIAS